MSTPWRDRFRARIELPVGRFFGRLGLTPNMLTLIGFGIALVAAYAAASEAWLVAGLLVAFGAIFDLFDGALARATGKVSRLGGFLDSTFDRAGEAAVYIGIAAGLMPVTGSDITRLAQTWPVGSEVGPLFALVAMAAAFMVSYTRAKSESLGFASGNRMSEVGLAPREVRTAIVALGLVAAGLQKPAAGDISPTYWWWLLVGSLVLVSVLATITTVQRIYFVYRQAQSQEESH